MNLNRDKFLHSCDDEVALNVTQYMKVFRFHEIATKLRDGVYLDNYFQKGSCLIDGKKVKYENDHHRKLILFIFSHCPILALLLSL